MKITNLLIGGTLLLLSSCSSGEKTASVLDIKAATEQVSPAASTTPGAKPATKEHGGKGGQVVESGKYHLELIADKSASETHLDLYVQKGDDHQAIPDAKVSGEIQSPDGQSKPISFTYDASGKHYTASVPGKAGAYQLKVTAAIGSDKADGRFSFDR
jgi:hypothetical protein